MNQIPDVYDEAAYSGTMWPKFGAPQQQKLFLWFQTHRGEIGSPKGNQDGLSWAKTRKSRG
jgi:hypothetical protein